MRVALRRGCIARQRAGAVVTSANDALCGNQQPEYWRFHADAGGAVRARRNADGAVREAGGAALEQACAHLPAVELAVARDWLPWRGTVRPPVWLT